MLQRDQSVAAASKAAMAVGAWVLAGAVAMLFAGCGQKGPLVLPSPVVAASAPPAHATPAASGAR